jgi:hypothetical protein
MLELMKVTHVGPSQEGIEPTILEAVEPITLLSYL